MSCNQETRDSNAPTGTASADSGLCSSSGKENIDTMESAEKDTTVTTTDNNEETKQESTNGLSLLEEGKLMIAYPTMRGSIRDKKKISEKLPGIPGTNTTNVSHQYHSQTPSEVESNLLRDAKLTVQYPAAHRKHTVKDNVQNKGGATDITPTVTTPECMPEPERISEDLGTFKKDHNRIIVSPRNVHNSRILRHTKESVAYPTCRKGSLPSPEQNTIPTPSDTPESYPDTSNGAHDQETPFPRPSEPKDIPNLQGSEILQTAKNMVDYPACRNDAITTSANAYPSGDFEADIPLHINQEEDDEEDSTGIIEVEASEGSSTRSSGGGGGRGQGNSAVQVLENNPIAGLAVARQVTGESSRRLDLPLARPYKGGSSPSQKIEDVGERLQSKKISIGLVVAVGIAISLTVILILVFLHGRGTQDIESETNQSNEQSESTPSQILTCLLPNYTLESLEDVNSPQWKAFNWTIHDPNFDTYQPWRLQQRFSLATFYYSAEGDSWGVGSQNSKYRPWLDYEQHECKWFSWGCKFVTIFIGNEVKGLGFSLHFLDQFANDCVFTSPCDGQDLEDSNQGRYKILTLIKRAKRGGGTIPPEIAMLTSLWGIGIVFSGISGSIPTEIGLLTSLQAIVFFSNELGSSIPSQIGMATDLVFLAALNEPLLSGTLPTEVGLLSNLSVMAILDTEMSGSIPTEMGGLSRLETLSLSWSSFCGSIPSELGQLSHIKVMRLLVNEISGVLPSHLGLLTNASLLDLSDNQLSGHVPFELGLMTSLTELDLNNNRLSGHVPSEVGLLSHLQKLKLSSNGLSGVLPSEFGNLLQLQYLHLNGNNITSVPTQIGLLSDLTALNASSNDIHWLPSELGLLSQLKTFYASSNRIHWLPSELGLLSQLTSLYASSNRIRLLPSELGLLSQLLELDLSDNSLKGTIKPQLGQLSQLETLQLRFNRFSGNVPTEFAYLQDLESLTLDNNALTGQFPDELMSLRGNGSLTLLTLANNSFSGKIPEGLCSLGLFDYANMNYYNGLGLSFDCNEQLCGCCWCPCSSNDTSAYCHV